MQKACIQVNRFLQQLSGKDDNKEPNLAREIVHGTGVVLHVKQKSIPKNIVVLQAYG